MSAWSVGDFLPSVNSCTLRGPPCPFKTSAGSMSVIRCFTCVSAIWSIRKADNWFVDPTWEIFIPISIHSLDTRGTSFAKLAANSPLGLRSTLRSIKNGHIDYHLNRICAAHNKREAFILDRLPVTELKTLTNSARSLMTSVYYQWPKCDVRYRDTSQ